MAVHSREIRAIPIWLLRSYFEEAGGTSSDDGDIVGPAWTARLAQIDDFHIGSLRIGQVRLEIHGDDAAVADLLQRIEPRLLRAGG